MSLIIQMEYHFSTFIAILGRTQACDMTSNIPQNVCGMAQASIGAFPPPPPEKRAGQNVLPPRAVVAERPHVASVHDEDI